MTVENLTVMFEIADFFFLLLDTTVTTLGMSPYEVRVSHNY